MKSIPHLVPILLVGLGLPALVGAASTRTRPNLTAQTPHPPARRFPWRQAGLTERQAAAHLLDRFTFGPRPGDVDRVLDMGLERWFERQLAGDLPEARLAPVLASLPGVSMSAEEMARTYPDGGLVLRRARREEAIPGGEDARPNLRDPSVRRKLFEFAREQGYRRQGELLGTLLTQKVDRALLSENQLREVLTDFWFNHFNVSLTNRACRSYVLAFERDAIRPNVTGPFRTLLGATARHPAMLLYLDNARSVAADGQETMLDMERARFGMRGGGRLRRGPGSRPSRAAGRGADASPGADRRPTGINENYARELMELHTLGVDGGFTQQDVIQVARAFTGWTVIPPWRMEEARRRLRQAGARGGPQARLGFVRDGAFLFRADAHDAEAKEILGVHFPAGRGIEDGEEVLDLLAKSPATAHHLARELAVRFVSDDPPDALVGRMAATYERTGGDLAEVMRTLAYSPEFWSPKALGQKIKSPFELAISALRATGARVSDPAAVVDWVDRMGEPLYSYQAPTGYPDRGEQWVSAGALLTRMSFGLELAAGSIPGVSLDLEARAGGREPESASAALATYARLLLPGRPLDATLKRLAPLVGQTGLAGRVAESVTGPGNAAAGEAAPESERRVRYWENPFPEYRPGSHRATPDTSPVAQVVGLILGSPEFQRR